MSAPTLGELTKLVRAGVNGEFRALLLFGSYSRGDFDIESDVDVLQVAEVPRTAYSIGNVSFAVYTRKQLEVMAREGSLFILHLLNEATPLVEGEELLASLRKQFQPQKDYSTLLRDVSVTAQLLDVPRARYERRWRKFDALVVNLLRTVVYVELLRRETLTFSMKRAAELMEDHELVQIIGLHRSTAPSFDEFVSAVRCLSRYLGDEIRNPFLSAEAAIVNAYGSSKLAVILGLRLLRDGTESFEYEELSWAQEAVER